MAVAYVVLMTLRRCWAIIRFAAAAGCKPSQENSSPNGGGVAGSGGFVLAGVPAQGLIAPAAFFAKGNAGMPPAAATESNTVFGSKYAQLCAVAAAAMAALYWVTAVTSRTSSCGTTTCGTEQ